MKHFLDLRHVILLTLLEQRKLTFRRLQRITKISPRILRRHLNDLAEKGWVKEKKPSGWKRGQKIGYELSKKGEREMTLYSAQNLQEGLKIMDKILTVMAQDPSRIEEWRKISRQTFPTIKVSGPQGGEFPITEDDAYEKQKIYEAFEKLLKDFNEFWVEINTFTNI